MAGGVQVVALHGAQVQHGGRAGGYFVVASAESKIGHGVRGVGEV